MTVEQNNRKTPFEEAAELGKKLRAIAEQTGKAEITIPSWLATLIRFRKEDLGKMGVAMVTENNQTRIVVSREGLPIIESVIAWMSKGEGEQRAIKATVYPSLFRIIQASQTSGVNLIEIVQSERKLIALKNSLPMLGELVDYLGKGGELTDRDKEELAGITRSIFSELEAVDDPRVKEWKGKGMDPEKMFVVPDEGA